MKIQVENTKKFVLKQHANIDGEDRTFNFIPGVKTAVNQKEFEGLKKHPSFVRNCQDGILLVYEDGSAQPQLFAEKKEVKKVPESKPVETKVEKKETPKPVETKEEASSK